MSEFESECNAVALFDDDVRAPAGTNELQNGMEWECPTVECTIFHAQSKQSNQSTRGASGEARPYTLSLVEEATGEKNTSKASSQEARRRELKYDELCNHTHEANEGYRRPAVGQPVCSAVRIPWRAGPLRGSVVVDDWHLKWHRDVYNCCTFDSARRIVPTARVRRRNAVTRLSTTAMRTSRTSLSTAHLALDGAPHAPRSRRRR